MIILKQEMSKSPSVSPNSPISLLLALIIFTLPWGVISPSILFATSIFCSHIQPLFIKSTHGTDFLKFDCECDINNFYPTMIVSSPLQFHHLQHHQFSAPYNSTTFRQKYMWYKFCYIILTMPIMNTVLIIQSRLQIQTS